MESVPSSGEPLLNASRHGRRFAPDKPLAFFDALWAQNVVRSFPGDVDMLYVDRHIVHEGSAVYAFDELARRRLKVARPGQTFGVVDHIVPTQQALRANPSGNAANMIGKFSSYCRSHGIAVAGLGSEHQGISHVFGHEQGITLPGLTIACCDSHTSTHGALGALAIPIGIAEIVQVLVLQSIIVKRPRVLRVRLTGRPHPDITAKDVILSFIGSIGVTGAAGCAIEFFGDYVDRLSLEGRLTLCNMAKEASAVTAVIAPDEKVFEYLAGRPLAPAPELWEDALRSWLAYASRAKYTQADIEFDAGRVEPTVTWGTTPQDVVPISGCVPDPSSEQDPSRRTAMQRALDYMGLVAGQRMDSVRIDFVFIGSCTNARIEDLRSAAALLRGRRIAAGVSGIVVPGSSQVKRAAEAEGLHRVFIDAGLEWRESGCSLCLAMNGDEGRPGSRIASTSNRNFEGRQGHNVRTHLLSPRLAAAAALAGRLSDPRDFPS